METQTPPNPLKIQLRDSKPLSVTPDKNESVAIVINYDSPLIDLDSTSPHTPKDAVFNSFAPGPDDLMLAPLVKKQVNSSRIDVARRLNFDSCIDKSKKQQVQDQEDEEEVLLDCVYRSLLDAIVKEVLADYNNNLLSEEEKENGFETPTKVPLLTGIAETCPAAPKKLRLLSKNIDLGLCRKLEF